MSHKPGPPFLSRGQGGAPLPKTLPYEPHPTSAWPLAWNARTWHLPSESQVTACTRVMGGHGQVQGKPWHSTGWAVVTPCSPPGSLLASLQALHSRDNQGSTVSDKVPPQPLPLFHSIMRAALSPGASGQPAPCPHMSYPDGTLSTSRTSSSPLDLTLAPNGCHSPGLTAARPDSRDRTLVRGTRRLRSEGLCSGEVPPEAHP